MATHEGILVLNQGVGYGIVVGIGAFFALLMYVMCPTSQTIINTFQAHHHLLAKSVHNVLHQAVRRIQHSLSERQARPHCRRHRLLLDMVLNATDVKHLCLLIWGE